MTQRESFAFVLKRILWERSLLWVPLVLLVHQAPWFELRRLTASATVEVLDAAGWNAHLASPTAIDFAGGTAQVSHACTLVHLLFATVIVLWNRRRTTFENLAWCSVFIVALELLNPVRIAGALVLQALGMPWFLAHDFVVGAFYYAIFEGICWRERSLLANERSGYASRSEFSASTA